MNKIGLNLEQELSSRGYKSIVGIDEAGRGPWAGPVVAACVLFGNIEALLQSSLQTLVNDSKLLSPKKREQVYNWLIENFDYGVGIVSHDVIDKINILAATKLAMKQSIDSLDSKPDYLLIDAVRLDDFSEIKQENIIKGDSKVWSIAAASIIAKVTRDRIMEDYHKQYSEYGFDQHKGYGTAKHRTCLEKFGVCPIHRRSYRPIKKFLID